jgi:Zn-dependent protease
MRGWSIPLGRWMGVEMRVHVFFPLLAVVCLALSGSSGIAAGLGLFLTLVAAVAVRETARLLVAAWLGLRLRAILLLPIGGFFAYADPESQEGSSQGGGQFALTLAGPVANLATALLLAAAFLGAGGNINLFAQPLISAPAPGLPPRRRTVAPRQLCAQARFHPRRPHGYRTGPDSGAHRHGCRHVVA